MPKRQKGVSGYLKPKKATLKQLDRADVPKRQQKVNPIDNMADEMNREEERKSGVTDFIRNIFND